MDKIELLNQLRQEKNLRYSLEIVPSIYTNSITPAISPSLKVIDFCHAIRCEIDIDYYLYDNHEEDEIE